MMPSGMCLKPMLTPPHCVASMVLTASQAIVSPWTLKEMLHTNPDTIKGGHQLEQGTTLGFPLTAGHQEVLQMLWTGCCVFPERGRACFFTQAHQGRDPPGAAQPLSDFILVQVLSCGASQEWTPKHTSYRGDRTSMETLYAWLSAMW